MWIYNAVDIVFCYDGLSPLCVVVSYFEKPLYLSTLRSNNRSLVSRYWLWLVAGGVDLIMIMNYVTCFLHEYMQFVYRMPGNVF